MASNEISVPATAFDKSIRFIRESGILEEIIINARGLKLEAPLEKEN